MEPKIALVVAIAENGAIGVAGGLPWRLPGDLAFFKRTTMGKPIVMGRRTWQSLPKRPLPGRPNLVVTRAAEVGAKAARDGAEVFGDLSDALTRARALAVQAEAEEVSIIGGAEIYRQTLPLADRLYITEVKATPAADTFFPAFDRSAWREVWREPGPPPKDPETPAPDYDFVLLERT
jgi:dihydrofolate reductase